MLVSKVSLCCNKLFLNSGIEIFDINAQIILENYDVLGKSEIWLNDNVDIDNYSLIHQNREIRKVDVDLYKLGFAYVLHGMYIQQQTKFRYIFL